MRFREITFRKVGPFADTSLVFREGAGVHVIKGANEAGKSSALRQMIALLFGFEPRSGDDFIHSYANHRIDAAIIGLDGQNHSVSRTRKKAGNTGGALTGCAPTGVLAPEGMSREEFLGLFGVDQASLRLGAEHLFRNGPSVLRSLMFDALTGIPSSAAISGAIRRRKEALFRPRSGKIADAVKAIRDLEEKVQQHEADQASKGREILALEENRREQERVHSKIVGLEQENRRLQAISAGLATHEMILRTVTRLETYAGIPEIREGFTEDWARASKTLAGATLEEEQAGLDIEAARGEMEKLPPAAIPAEIPDRIPSLAGQVERVRDALERIPKLQAGLVRALGEAGAVLAVRCPGSEAANLASILPAPNVLDRIRRASKEVEEATAACVAADSELSLAKENVQERQRKLDLLPVPRIQPGLRELLEESDRESALLGSLSEDSRDLENQTAELLDECSSMAPPIADLGALEAIRIPPRADIGAIEEAWNSANAILSDAAERNRKDRTELERIGLELAGNLAAGGSVDPVLLQRARGLRNRVWEVIRAQRVGSQALDGAIPELLAEEGSAATVDEALPALIAKADSLADAQVNNATTVLDINRARGQLAELGKKLQAGEAEIKEKQADLEPVLRTLSDTWSSTWVAGGAGPPGPLAVGEWMDRARDLKRSLAAIRKLERKLGDTRSRRNRLVVRFQALLDGFQGSLEEAGQRARAVVGGWDSQAAARGLAEKSLEEARQQEELRDRTARARKADLERRRGVFSGLVRAPWACVEGDHEGFAEDLDALSRTRAEILRLEGELESLRGARDSFFGELRGVALQSGVANAEPADDTWETVWATVQRLAREETERARDSTNCAKRIAAKVAELPAISAQAARARQKVGQLLGELGLEAPDSVPGLLEKAGQQRRLRDELIDLEKQLLKDTKMSPADYSALRGDMGRERVEDQMALVGDDLDRLRERGKELSIAITGAEKALKELLGNEKGLKLRSDMEQGRNSLRGLLSEWRRLRLAELCLNEAAEEVRVAGGETPAAWAKDYFGRMTLGRYNDLEINQGEEGFALQVTRPDPGYVQSRETIRNNPDKTGLSEGTADQLWLAIRLAGIRMRVMKMREEGLHPMPVIIDDALVSFDDERAVAAIEVLAGLGELTQVILFTHHAHMASAARDRLDGKVDLINMPGPAD
jgi:uncharacterized protein YhaN